MKSQRAEGVIALAPIEENYMDQIKSSVSWLLPLLLCCLVAPCPARGQEGANESLSGPDTHERNAKDRDHLFGEWDGERQRLLERGVDFDLQYLSDSLWNLRSVQKDRLAMWNRVRGTVDIDLSKLTHTPGVSFHITGLWQGGGNLGAYLGTIAGPSGMASANTFRLDSYWFEKRWAEERVAFRFGQFAGQDFYGSQHYAASFIFEPLGYAMGNLSSTNETYDPPSTPAAEVRVVPVEHFYVKSMVFAAYPNLYAHNPTGFVPQFRGAAMSASEVGWTPGQRASSVRAFDTVQTRRGYSGLYQLGGAYNPGKFHSTQSVLPVSGNYLIYAIASQAIWRTSPNSEIGLDITAGVNWTPHDRSRSNQETTAGLLFNEHFPIRRHNTLSFGYVRNHLNNNIPLSVSNVPAFQAETALELNSLIEITRSIVVQPVVQTYLNVGGSSSRSVTVFGFRIRVDL